MGDFFEFLLYLLSMGLHDYLKRFKDKNSLYFIGPRYNGALIHEPIVFVDSGANYREGSLGFSIGDNDSFDGRLDEVLATDKDQSDLATALWCLPLHFSNLYFYGFLKGRGDHELATFLEVLSWVDGRKIFSRCVWDENAVEVLGYGSQGYNYKGTFSVFSFFENTKITIDGDVKYKVLGKIKTMSSHGLSNEAMGEFVIHADRPVLVYFTCSDTNPESTTG